MKINRQILFRTIANLLLITSVILLAACGILAESNSLGSAVSITAPVINNGQDEPPNNMPGTPPAGGPPSGRGGPGDPGNSVAATGTAIYTQSSDNVTKSNVAINASHKDESGIKVTDSGNLTLSDSTVTTSGETSSMDSSSFYGLNAAVLAESGSEVTIDNCTIKTTGSGANGVFATGTGSLVALTNVKIDCAASGAHGVDATIDGTLVLTNVDIITAGNGAAAAIATDRGGGTIIATGGTVLTSGGRSPGIYSTGDISIASASITATGSEAAVIEGKNSITLTDTSLVGTKLCGVMIYQSMSGDADTGTGNFKMTGGSLSAGEGPLFFVTNTKALITLADVDLTAPSGILLKAVAADWGTNGSNGGSTTFTADSETLNGNIVCDNISTIVATLQNGTILNGAINTDNKAKSVELTLDKTSIWNVSATSYLAGLTDDDTTFSNIADNGNTIYYESATDANKWLNNGTYVLIHGGKLTPALQQ